VRQRLQASDTAKEKPVSRGNFTRSTQIAALKTPLSGLFDSLIGATPCVYGGVGLAAAAGSTFSAALP
jgi:hypothetical protein